MNVTARNKRTGKVQFAREAYNCREDGHECPDCGVDVEIRCSTCGTYYTKLYPKRRHAPGCNCMGMEDSKRVIDQEEIDADDLFTHILTPRPKRKKGKKGRHPGPPHQNQERKTGITDLIDIYSLGLQDQPDKAINARWRLKDLLLNQCTVNDVDIGDGDLGKRIIYAKPINYIGPPYRVLRFGIFWSRGYERMMHVFDLILASDQEYWDMFAQLFVQDPAAGMRRHKYRSKFKRVLICGIWSAYPNMTSNGKWRCMGYHKAVCPLPTQQICTNDIDLAD